MEHNLSLTQWLLMWEMLKLSTRALAETIDWEVYYYLSAWKLIEELPLISTNKNTFLVNIKVLLDKWLLERKVKENKSYYRLSEIWKEFDSVEKNQESVEKNQHRSWKKSTQGVEKNQDNNNTIYNNTIYNKKIQSFSDFEAVLEQTGRDFAKEYPTRNIEVEKKACWNWYEAQNKTMKNWTLAFVNRLKPKKRENEYVEWVWEKTEEQWIKERQSNKNWFLAKYWQEKYDEIKKTFLLQWFR